MSRRSNTRYPHAFSKGKGPGFHSQGSWRQGVGMGRPPKASLAAGARSGGGGVTDESLYPVALDPLRWKVLKVSPTIATVYADHLGLAVICADCLHGVGYRNPGLKDRFRRQWHLTLIEIEKRCRCGMCGSRNARVYPWAPSAEGLLGLEGPGR